MIKPTSVVVPVAQSMAREYWPHGINIVHFGIDRGIAGECLLKRNLQLFNWPTNVDRRRFDADRAHAVAPRLAALGARPGRAFSGRAAQGGSHLE